MIDDKIENHPLLVRVAEINKQYYLPEILLGDPQRMKQVLINMINNSIQCSNNGEVYLDIHYDRPQEQLIFVITDQGMGIKSEDQKQLFKLFGKRMLHGNKD
jgi:signal transduction histidine kinase